MADEKQRINSDRKYEIRRILLGHIIRREDGTLSVTEPGQMLFQGFRNGWGAARILGIGCTERQYSCSAGNALSLVHEAFGHAGRKVVMKTLTEGSACLCRSGFGSPVLLTVEWKERSIRIAAYSGRSPLAPFRRKWILRKVEKHMGSYFNRIDIKVKQKKKSPKKKQNKRRSNKKA